MINLVSAISSTSIAIALNKAETSGQPVPQALVNAKQADTNVNTFAFNEYVQTVQTLQTLLDPNNDANAVAASDTNAVQQVSQAYQAAASLAPRNPVQPTANPVDISI